jgi:hypothetical protein
MLEDRDTQFDDLTQVLRDAHLRRTADLGSWLRQYVNNRRQVARLKEAKLDVMAISSVIGTAAGQTN